MIAGARRIIACAAAVALFAAAHAPASPGLVDGYRVHRSPSGAFIVQYPPALEPMAREIEGLLERSAPSIAAEIGLETIAPIRVYLAPDDRAYAALHEGRIPEWGIAFSDVADQILGFDALRIGVGPRPLRAVARHELSHLLVAQRVGAVSVPTWFMEGLAIRQAEEWSLADEWSLTLIAGRTRLPYLEELAGAFPRESDRAALAYGLSYKAVTELLRDRPGALMTLTAFARDRGDFEDAFVSTFGLTPYEYASRFYVLAHRRYRAPGAVINAGPYWLAFALLFVAVYLAKKARARRKLREMEERERAARSFAD